MQDTGEEESDFVRQTGESAEEFFSRLSASIQSHDNPHALTLSYSQRLSLGRRVGILALNICDAADGLTALRFSPANSIAAASVYIASHILDQPRSLADVADLTDCSQRTIHCVYRAIHHHRYLLIDEDWRQIVGGTTLGESAEALSSLPWPLLEQEFVDSESDLEEGIEMDNENEPFSPGGLEMVLDLCYQFQASDERFTDPVNRIWVMADHIVHELGRLTCDWRTSNPWTIAAACTYFASHMVFQGRTFEEVSQVLGIPPASIRNTYEVLHSVREQLVPDHLFLPFDWSRYHAFDRLPEP